MHIRIAKPLHRLTECSKPFAWTSECKESFNRLKHQLTTPPVLAFPDFAAEFVLDTDASDHGIGGVLSQVQSDGQERVVAYASRLFSKSEKRYSITRKELLAVVVFLNYCILGSIFWERNLLCVRTMVHWCGFVVLRNQRDSYSSGQKKFPFPFISVQFKHKPNVIKMPFHFKAVPSFVACKLTGKLIQDV